MLGIKAKIKKKEREVSAFEKLLIEHGVAIPKMSDVVHGTVLSVERNAIRIDIPGYRVGVVRGPELKQVSEYTDLKPGDNVEAMVIELENEAGELELSFRFAGVQRAWEKVRELMTTGTIVPVKITEANKGGLIAHIQNIAGFLPVSQLSPENYPRVPGGDKQRIFEKLRSFVGKPLNVKVIDINEAENKLIVSEKAVWEDAQREVIAACKVGEAIEGEVTALADFGAFVKFQPQGGGEEASPLEGLVHISEIAWQRIDHPRDILKVGDTVRAEIIGVEGSRIFLSMKNLIEDPWKTVGERYKVGQLVKGKILKENPFGFFVELDPDIHGLAHISELADRPVKSLAEVAKPGDELEWRILSIEPEQHRLGLSLKTMKEPVATGTEPPVIPDPRSRSRASLIGDPEPTATTAKTEEPKEEPKNETIASS